MYAYSNHDQIIGYPNLFILTVLVMQFMSYVLFCCAMHSQHHFPLNYKLFYLLILRKDKFVFIVPVLTWRRRESWCQVRWVIQEEGPRHKPTRRSPDPSLLTASPSVSTTYKSTTHSCDPTARNRPSGENLTSEILSVLWWAPPTFSRLGYIYRATLPVNIRNTDEIYEKKSWLIFST